MKEVRLAVVGLQIRRWYVEVMVGEMAIQAINKDTDKALQIKMPRPTEFGRKFTIWLAYQGLATFSARWITASSLSELRPV